MNDVFQLANYLQTELLGEIIATMLEYKLKERILVDVYSVEETNCLYCWKTTDLRIPSQL